MAQKRRSLCLERLESRQLMAAMPLPESIVEAADETYELVDVRAASGIRAAEVLVRFDPNTTRVEASDIRAGSVWQGRAAVIAKVDQVAGTIKAFLFTTRPLAGDAGNLIDIDFDVPDGMAEDIKPVFAIDRVKLDEGRVRLAPEVESPRHAVRERDGGRDRGRRDDRESKRRQSFVNADAETVCESLPPDGTAIVRTEKVIASVQNAVMDAAPTFIGPVLPY